MALAMEANLSLDVPHADSVSIDEIASDIQFLSTKTLQDIARGPLVKLISNCDDKEKVKRVWQSLITTLSTTSLPHQHTSAACNAVGAFLEAAVKSKNVDTKRLALSLETWLAVINIFLNRYEDAKPKPLKQLLLSLATIMARNYQQPQKDSVQQLIAFETLPSIILGEPRSRLKTSLTFLEIFVRKNAISPLELITLAQKWLTDHFAEWTPIFEKDSQILYSDCDQHQTVGMPREPSQQFAARVFVLGLLNQSTNRELSGACSGLLAAFIQRMGTEKISWPISTAWVAPVRHVMLQNSNDLDILSTNLLEPVFLTDPTGFFSFVESLPLKNVLAGDIPDTEHSEYMLLLSALRIGKKTSLVHEDYDASKSNKGKESVKQNLVLKSEVLGKLLLHRESDVRIAALSLLIAGSSSIKPMTKAATDAILQALPSLHAESDSYSRGEILSLTRKFIIRLKSGILAEHDVSQVSLQAPAKLSATLTASNTETKDYLRKYLDFLLSDLCVTASYPRHISALKVINLLLISGLDSRAGIAPLKSEVESRWKIQMDIFDIRLLRLLVDLLLDQFEEVRQTSLSILNLFPQDILMVGLINMPNGPSGPGTRLVDALTRAEGIASKSSRADHADTVARLYHVIFCAAGSTSSRVSLSDWWLTKVSVVNTILGNLEDRLSSSNGLFTGTLREAPLHGYMSGLRYIVSMPDFHSLISNDSTSTFWRNVHDRILQICDNVWQEVKPVLCVDSPEGHTDEPIDELSVGPKDILSYSWRALRESSLLLHATMFNVTYGPSGPNGLQRMDFENVGRASFTQLAELRHRGAFSTVSQTFATCCQRCSSSKDPSIQGLPHAWYQEAKSILFESASKLTRRSAGLPALVTGILCSSPGTQFFKTAMKELHDISHLSVEYDQNQQYLKLPQVHAMNCLKDVFTNTKLVAYTEPFIMSALTLSAERLGSPIWALRNSGLMLFRALLSKMCRVITGTTAGFGGASGSEPGSKISFQKYPGLLELLSTLLAPTEGTIAQQGTDIVTERIFPALELIGEKTPSIGDSSDVMICNLVREHLKSPVWGIREHAARVYASLLARTNILKDVRDLIGLLQDNVSENYIHGTVLCVQYSLRRFEATTDVFWTSNVDDLQSTLCLVFNSAFSVARSPSVVTSLVEILNDTLERSMQAQVEDHFIPLLNKVFDEHDLEGVVSHLFDVSHDDWNLTSLTRASSLLRRALAWCTMLKMLTSQKWSDILSFYHGVHLFDADTAHWVSERLQETLSQDHRYRKPMVDLYSWIIVGHYRSDVKTQAVSNLAYFLEEQLVSPSMDPIELPVSLEELETGFRPHTDIQEWNRQATDAEVRLQGCILALQATSSKVQGFSVNTDFKHWIVKLRSALSEETEFTTRYAAVKSVHTFVRGLRTGDQPARADAGFFDLYLILYDFLNDDDEEVRDIAASAASWVLSYSPISPDKAITLSPLNASTQLVHFIIDHYSDSMELARRVIRYITGQEARISGSDDQTHLLSVSDLIAEYSQENTVLFREEKQNLFIDEVREVDMWSQALLCLTRQAYPETLLRQISSWVSEGLEYLTTQVTQEDSIDGLLGWISKPESFTLGIRIISISSALISPRFSAPVLMDVSQQTLQSQLQSLLTGGNVVSMHSNWMCRIQKGLDVRGNEINQA
ncbi:hypothetical protein N7462_009724 [Penicillium macrosclerotiorum]|uniref:uncharacterized protein n=1 Tax=Penicillium macrosclerotiorum TaxID=303699 RepID=UPI0025491AF7|nr:uncharacterized protein N7462_009724 [Penicillium macrosclerotiorum]KAJ5668654.1 hypothetical protein N7462_009724 [Penicillium macrosclerotiorum]